MGLRESKKIKHNENKIKTFLYYNSLTGKHISTLTILENTLEIYKQRLSKSYNLPIKYIGIR